MRKVVLFRSIQILCRGYTLHEAINTQTKTSDLWAPTIEASRVCDVDIGTKSACQNNSLAIKVVIFLHSATLTVS